MLLISLAPEGGCASCDVPINTMSPFFAIDELVKIASDGLNSRPSESL